MRQRIVPFVDHEIGYRLLQKLIACATAQRIDIPAVVTSLENGESWWPGVQNCCLQAGIPLIRYAAPFSAPDLLHHADWFLLLSWKHIIPAELINIPERGVMNLHYSLLPDLRGVYPVNWAIMQGRRRTGITFHFVDERIDEGEVFMQVEVPVRLSDTARTLQARLDEVAFAHFDDLLERLLRHEGAVAVRLSAPPTSAEYYSRGRFESSCAIDLDKHYRGIDLINLLRGLTFFEESNNAYIIDNETGKKVYLSLRLREE
jgi:methionyl-tRNA formyltransferase